MAIKPVSRRASSKEIMAGVSFSGWCARACMVCGVVLMTWPLIESIYNGRGSTTRSAIGTPRSSNPPRAVPSDVAFPATPPQPIIENPVSTGQSSGGRRGRTMPHRPHTPAQKAEQAARVEILTLYEKWKENWETENMGDMMSLYSPRLRFRDIADQLYDHSRFREWLRLLWQQNEYFIMDLHPPELVITGNRAVLKVEQGYGDVEQPPLQYFKSHYVWEKQKTDARWLIVEEVYLPYRGDRRSDSSVIHGD